MTALTRYWWMFLLRGIFALLFGVVVLAYPAASLAALVLVFGAYAFIDGVVALMVALFDREQRSWELVFEAVAGILMGVVTFFYPAATALALYTLIAVWAIVTGIFELAASWRLRRRFDGAFWLGLGGAFSIIFGVLLLALPAAGWRALAWLIAVYALLFGAMLVALSLRLKQLGSNVSLPRTPTQPLPV